MPVGPDGNREGFLNRDDLSEATREFRLLVRMATTFVITDRVDDPRRRWRNSIVSRRRAFTLVSTVFVSENFYEHGKFLFTRSIHFHNLVFNTLPHWVCLKRNGLVNTIYGMEYNGGEGIWKIKQNVGSNNIIIRHSK